MTTLVTGATIFVCFLIRRHYESVQQDLKRLDDVLVPVQPVPVAENAIEQLDHKLPTAILTVDRFSGYGIHQILSIHTLFPKYYKNFVFVSVAVVDSGNFKGSDEMGHLEADVRQNLEKYVAWCRAQGWNAGYKLAIAHRSRREGRRDLQGAAPGVSAVGRVQRQARLREGGVVPPPPPQRDGDVDPAEAPVRGRAGDRAAGPRRGLTRLSRTEVPLRVGRRGQRARSSRRVSGRDR